MNKRSIDRLQIGVWVPVAAKHALVRIAEKQGKFITQLVNGALVNTVRAYADDLNGSGFDSEQIVALLEESAAEQSKYAANKAKPKGRPGRPKKRKK